MQRVYTGNQIRVCSFQKVIRRKEQNFEFVDRDDVVLCLPFDDKGRLILLDQYRSPIDSNSLELPAGKVDQGETLEAAVRRELLEEIGYKPDSLEEIGLILSSPHFSNERVFVFSSTGKIVENPRPTDAEDFLGTKCVNLDQIDNLIGEGVLQDGKSLAALVLFRAKNLNKNEV